MFRLFLLFLTLEGLLAWCWYPDPAGDPEILLLAHAAMLGGVVFAALRQPPLFRLPRRRQPPAPFVERVSADLRRAA